MISLPEHLGLKPLQRAISYTEDISRFYKGNRFMLYNKKNHNLEMVCQQSLRFTQNHNPKS